MAKSFKKKTRSLKLMAKSSKPVTWSFELMAKSLKKKTGSLKLMAKSSKPVT
jgi:hypothetical protein